MSAEHSVVIVTGAAGALGSVLVAELVERGARVAAVDHAAASSALASVAERHPGCCLSIVADTKLPGAWPALLERVERELGAPQGAALVAGGWRGGQPFWSDGADAIWQSMLEMNLETARAALQALLPGMVERRSGSIVLVGSRAAERPWESAGAAAYAAAKAAVVALAQAVAAETRESGVRVNVVLPSILDTPANRRSMPNADFSSWVSPSSLSAVIGFLLSDAARDISGAAIPVYGRV
jgi:NAD(P)-dependent dehydrogenase (short-subunit alcohol dehydrogenase family)